jgi:hypothetical protein
VTTKATHVTAVDGLVELARQVRGCTLELSHVADGRWLTWAPTGTSNHILWHAGHAVWLQDALTIRPITGRSELPHGWSSVFGQNSQPELHSDWPDVAEVRALLEDQLGRIEGLLRTNAELILTKANAIPPTGGWPLLPGMIHGWHDEARHQGEMYLLHKLLRAF